MSSLVKPLCTNEHTLQILEMNRANKHATEIGSITDIIKQVHIRPSMLDSYKTLLINLSQEYYKVYQSLPNTAVAEQAFLEFIHYKFLVNLLLYSRTDFTTVLAWIKELEDKAQSWKIYNLKDFINGKPLNAGLKIIGLGTFLYNCEGYIDFIDIEGNRISILCCKLGALTMKNTKTGE